MWRRPQSTIPDRLTDFSVEMYRRREHLRQMFCEINRLHHLTHSERRPTDKSAISLSPSSITTAS
jgi:hypothetical protein